MLPLVLLALVTILPVGSSAARHPIVFAEGEVAPVDEGKLPDAVNKLKELGIVSDPQYWLLNARKGKNCEGGMVAEVIINAGKKFDPSVSEIEAAVDVLIANNVLKNKETGDYWKKRAVAGGKCSGNFTSIMLVGMADTL